MVYVCRDSDGGFSFIHHLWRLWNEGPESFVQDLHSLVNHFWGVAALVAFTSVEQLQFVMSSLRPSESAAGTDECDHDSIEELRAMKAQNKHKQTQPMPCTVTSDLVYLAS